MNTEFKSGDLVKFTHFPEEIYVLLNKKSVGTDIWSAYNIKDQRFTTIRVSIKFGEKRYIKLGHP